MKRYFIAITLAILLLQINSSCSKKEKAGEALSADKPIYADSLVDKTSGMIGDKVRYSIKVRYNKDLTVSFPEYKDEIGGLSIKDSGEKPAKTRGDYTTVERWYRLEAFTPGAYIIPAAVISYLDKNGTKAEINVPQIFIDIKSSIKEGEKASDIKDIKMPVFLKENRMLLLIIAVSILALVLSALFAVRYYQKLKAKRLGMIPPRPPHEIAFEEMEALLRRDLISQGRYKEFYTILSDIIRHYIEKRFSIKAKEETTQEFLNEVSYSNILEEAAKKIVEDFLAVCDMVKFAKYGPVPEEAQEAYSLAREFVHKTMPQTTSQNDKIIQNVQ